jgi:hypothetical protein
MSVVRGAVRRVAWLVVATAGSVACTSTSPTLLGEAPLCEASGAVRVPWDRDLVLVVDNEIPDRLFGFRVGVGGRLVGDGAVDVRAPVLPDDPEDLAAMGRRLLIVGSHGRSSRCVRRPERERLLVVEPDGAGGLRGVHLADSEAAVTRALRSEAACLEALFVVPPPAHADAVCSAIVAAARAVSSSRCIPPLDIEGAAGVPVGGGRTEVWLGLRQPRVRNGRAVMLRLADAVTELRFDAVVLVADGDRGVRALAEDDGTLWAILGPGPPDFGGSALWRLSTAELVAGAEVAGELVRDDLPAAAEGLVFDGRDVLVVTDGEQPVAPGAPCSTPARQLRLPAVRR